jgi:GNAT superfamily N-acetyltransferase
MIYSDKDLSQKIERAEAQSTIAFVESRANLFPASGACWTKAGGAFAMFDAAQSPCTQTFGLGLFEAPGDAGLDEIELFFKERGAGVFHEVSPLADASTLNLLNSRGYIPFEMSNVLYMPLPAEINPNLSINPKITTRIIEAGEENIWAQTSAEGWADEMEGFADFMLEFGRISAGCEGAFPYLAELEGKFISTGMLFIHEDTAVLAGASTVPDGRGQGGQTALLAARLRFAAERGCTIAVMGAMCGSGSQRNAEKNGFRVAYTRTKWKLSV